MQTSTAPDIMVSHGHGNNGPQSVKNDTRSTACSLHFVACRCMWPSRPDADLFKSDRRPRYIVRSTVAEYWCSLQMTYTSVLNIGKQAHVADLLP